MRRWILLLLLAVLPLQFAQAAAAAYCAHEKTLVKQHFGHHEHDHHDAAASTDVDADSEPAGATDTDCDYCHLSSAQPLASIAPQWSVFLDRRAERGLIQTFASHDGNDVERPKWLPPARSAGSRVSLLN